MGKIFKNRLQSGIFAAALVITVIAGILAYMNTILAKDYANWDYNDYYVKNPDFYTVIEVPIKEFETISGLDDKFLLMSDLYRVCLVDITFEGGQTMTFRVSSDIGDKKGDKIKVAYNKKWDINYDMALEGEDVGEDSILVAIRAQEVFDGLYAVLFTLIAMISAIFAAVVFFICYKKKDAYEL